MSDSIETADLGLVESRRRTGLGLRRLGRNVALTLSRQLIGVVLSLGLSLLLARALGPMGNGQYTMLVLLPTLLSNVLSLGIAPANVYFIGRGTVTVDVALRATLRMWAVIGGAGAVTAIVFVSLYGERTFPGVPAQMLIIAALLFPIALLEALLVGILQGVQDFSRYNRATLVAPIVTLGLAAISILVFKFGVVGAFVAYGIGHFSGAGVALVCIRPHFVGSTPGPDKLRHYTRSAIGYGWKAHLSNILAFLNYRADVFLINLLSGPATTGIYIIAVQLTERLWMLSRAVSTVLLPRLAEVHAVDVDGHRLTLLVARWVFVSSLLAAGVQAILAQPVIYLLFGASYASAVQAVLLLLPGVVLGSVSRVLANDLAARGRPEINLYLSLVVIGTNILGNVVLIPRFGMNGAAMATTLAYSLNATAKIYIHARLSGQPWRRALLPTRGDCAMLARAYRMLRARAAGPVMRTPGSRG